MKERCEARVYRSEDARGARCSKRAKVEVDGKSYCAVHDPARADAKRAARERLNDAKWNVLGANWQVEKAEKELLAWALGHIEPTHPSFVRWNELQRDREHALAALAELEPKR